MAKSAKQIQDEITKKIIESLTEGNIPWRKPWHSSPNCGSPTNFVSGNTYRGINPLLLSMHQEKLGFSSKWYGTFKQWQDIGGKVMHRPKHIKPGDWGCSIVYYARFTKTKTDPNTGEEIEDQFSVLKNYSVFNAEQVELPAKYKHLADTGIPTSNIEFIDFAPAEYAIQATQADIRHGGEQCYYSRSGDYIQMVEKNRFHSEKDYYASALHELAHWSEKRCDWDNTTNYAEGELRAELAASFMCSELQIPNSDDLTNVKAYLQSWLKALKNNSKLIFKASSAASKACDFILDFSRQPNTEPSLV